MQAKFKAHLQLAGEIGLAIWIIVINLLFYLKFLSTQHAQFSKAGAFIAELLRKW